MENPTVFFLMSRDFCIPFFGSTSRYFRSVELFNLSLERESKKKGKKKKRANPHKKRKPNNKNTLCVFSRRHSSSWLRILLPKSQRLNSSWSATAARVRLLRDDAFFSSFVVLSLFSLFFFFFLCCACVEEEKL